MSVFGIVQVNIHDPSWIEQYVTEVTPLLTKYGGKYLTRTENIELLEGDSKPQVAVVSEFPSREHALEFYHSCEYEPYKKARQKGATSQFLIVDIENTTQ